MTLSRDVVAGACAGSCVVLVTTPLDVIKVRMQTLALSRSPPSLLAALPSPAPPHAPWVGSAHVAARVLNSSGIRAMWRGVPAGLLMASPSSGVYMALYDRLHRSMQHSGAHPAVASLASGSLSRAFTAVIMCPLELARTQQQASIPLHSTSLAPAGRSPQPMSLLQCLMAQVQRGGARSLWQGSSANIMRDVPFSAIYWCIVELVRDAVAPKQQQSNSSRDFGTNALAAVSGGAVATLATHPMDVAKTLMQTSVQRPLGLRATLSGVVAQKGYSALWVGLFPRLMKVAPSCAIALTTFEAVRHFLCEKEWL